MNLKIAAVPILVLVVSLSTIGFVNAQVNNTSTASSGQTGAPCSKENLKAAQEGFASIQKKMRDLMRKSYANWQTAHSSGQYNGTFQQYLNEKISSSDISQINSDRKKFSSVLISCGSAGNMASQSVPSSATQSDLQIPSWIKNNAKWWSQGQIGDSEFVQGIQYLIKHGIMKIPQTQSNSTLSQQIPSWIKTNAGWWASGQISDGDFVKGIEYLVSSGIIHV